MSDRRRVMVAMSGGVDSSVAAALVAEAGHEVVGVTMRLWGGESDSGCCSVADVDDARRAADHLGLEHHVFNFSDEFEARVVGPYVADHLAGLTPNPCIECNRHLKFDRLLERARVLGFDAVATGHHARIVTLDDGRRRLARGADPAKDQSYVLYTLGGADLGRVMFPIGHLSKVEVRRVAARLGLRTAAKPDSQDVCFITSAEGRHGFLGRRATLTPGTIRDSSGRTLGSVPAVQLVTIGQRKGLGLAAGDGTPRYVTDVDLPAATVTVGPLEDLLSDRVTLVRWSCPDRRPSGDVSVQTSAHASPEAARIEGDDIVFDRPRRRIAPGQSVVVYEGDTVAGGGIVSGGSGLTGDAGESDGGRVG